MLILHRTVLWPGQQHIGCPEKRYPTLTPPQPLATRRPVPLHLIFHEWIETFLAMLKRWILRSHRFHHFSLRCSIRALHQHRRLPNSHRNAPLHRLFRFILWRRDSQSPPSANEWCRWHCFLWGLESTVRKVPKLSYCGHWHRLEAGGQLRKNHEKSKRMPSFYKTAQVGIFQFCVSNCSVSNSAMFNNRLRVFERSRSDPDHWER